MRLRRDGGTPAINMNHCPGVVSTFSFPQCEFVGRIGGRRGKESVIAAPCADLSRQVRKNDVDCLQDFPGQRRVVGVSMKNGRINTHENI